MDQNNQTNNASSEFKPTPMPASNQPSTPQPMPANPEPVEVSAQNGVPEAAPAAEVSSAPVVDNQPEEITVINNEQKSKGGGIVLVILIIILAVFVWNIDFILDLYNQYFSFTPSRRSTNNNNTQDNLLDGYILIGDESSITTDDVKFYNFNKSSGALTITYMASKRIDDTSALGITIELYNANKEILAKELFNVIGGLDKDVVKTYSMQIDSSIQASVYYARLRKYTENDKKSTQGLSCSNIETRKDGSTIKSNITYLFKNNELISYSVTKTYVPVSSEEGNENVISSPLENEYNNLPTTLKPSLISNKLTYTVNLENDLAGYNPLYTKGTIITNIKNKEQQKDWKCN